MIFDIYVMYDDGDFKDVYLDMALEDYHGATYRAQLCLDKAKGVATLNSNIFYSECGDIEFDVRDPNEVPSWVKRLIIHLTGRMHEVLEKGKSIRRWLEDEELV